jgi:hypothetical protein
MGGRTTKNIIGPEVAKIRGSRDWSQATLAAKCQLKGWDVSRGVIAGIEGRHRVVEDWEVFVLASVMEVSADKLFPAGLDWTQFPAPSEKTQQKRRRVLAKIKARSEQEHS